MKKLIILVSLIALLASGMVFAQVQFSGGKVELEVANDFDAKKGEAGLEKYDPDVRIGWAVKIDDFNTAGVRMRLNDAGYSGFPEESVGMDFNSDGDMKDGVALSQRFMYFDRAFFTTDVTGALGVKGVGVSSTVGLNEYVAAHVGNIEWDIAKGMFEKTFTKWGASQTVKADPVSLTVAYSLQEATLQSMYVDAVASFPAGPGSLKAEVAYGLNNKEMGEGYMKFGAEYGMKMGDAMMTAAGSLNLELDDEKSGKKTGYGAGVKYAMPMVAVFAGAQGFTSEIGTPKSKAQVLHNVRLAANLMPSKLFGADVGVILYTGGEDKIGTDDRDLLNTLDISAYVNLGKATYRFGYILVPDKDKSIDPWKTDCATKALYFVGTVPF